MDLDIVDSLLVHLSNHRCFISKMESGRQKIAPEDVPYQSKERPGLRLLRMSWPEWYLILIGCIASAVNGALQPGWSLVLSEVIRVSQLEREREERGGGGGGGIDLSS